MCEPNGYLFSQNNDPNPRRNYKGRQRVTMAKMENETSRIVTFSKRRAGLFKKASELCTLCGAEAIIIVFSPGSKVYSFGHPSVEAIADRFLSRNDLFLSFINHLAQPADNSSNICNLNLVVTLAESTIRAQKKWANELDEMRRLGQGENWYPGVHVDRLNALQLQKKKEALLDLKKNLDIEAQKGKNINTSLNSQKGKANPNPGEKVGSRANSFRGPIQVSSIKPDFSQSLNGATSSKSLFPSHCPNGSNAPFSMPSDFNSPNDSFVYDNPMDPDSGLMSLCDLMAEIPNFTPSNNTVVSSYGNTPRDPIVGSSTMVSHTRASNSGLGHSSMGLNTHQGLGNATSICSNIAFPCDDITKSSSFLPSQNCADGSSGILSHYYYPSSAGS